jgi:hypothetical protein
VTPPSSEPSGRFDRIKAPRPGSIERDSLGKEALYSTAPTAAPTRPVHVTCRRCGVERGMTFREAVALLRPPVLINPVTGVGWLRCPTCQKRSWVEVTTGQSMRALLSKADPRRRS